MSDRPNPAAGPPANEPPIGAAPEPEDSETGTPASSVSEPAQGVPEPSVPEPEATATGTPASPASEPAQSAPELPAAHEPSVGWGSAADRWSQPGPLPEPEAPAQIAPEPIAADPSSPAEPAPEAESSPQEAVVAEPRTTVEAIAEPHAPAQIAPEFGEAPTAEPHAAEPATESDAPGPAASDPASPDPAAADAAPVALEPGTEDTLALPPTTKEVGPPSAPSVPPPPSGVPVPFAAPPTERNSGRFTAKLVISLVGGVLLIGGVIVAIVVAFFVFMNSVSDKVEATAADFIAEIADEDWAGAHAMLCDDLRSEPVATFIPEWEAWEAEGADVGPISSDGTAVEVEFADGTAIALVIEVDEGSETLDMNVCGWRPL